MQEQEAIKNIINDACKCCKTYFEKCDEKEDCAYYVAISALEKQIPKKPRLSKGCNWSYRCPSCGNLLFWTDEPKNHGIKYAYCPDCGQHIDWD